MPTRVGKRALAQHQTTELLCLLLLLLDSAAAATNEGI
jgi:hypothetical protein